jgi:hypothetical protein
MAPVIIATDKTQLTQFSGSKAAYPVYLTIGNIPKATRRKPSKKACVLIAYLSVDKINRKGMTVQEHRSRVQRVFHDSMRLVLKPLMEAGDKGVEMTGSDGTVRKVHPILSCYVADYPEQCLVACTKYGTCVKCKAPAKDLGNSIPAQNRTQEWTLDILEEAKVHSNGKTKAFHTYCMSHEVAGGVFEPFWKGFPYCDIHRAITPDVLHQLYQGVFKHLVGWCQTILTPQQLDNRIRTLPPSYGLRHFKNGISALSQISGTERKNMAKILLGCLVGSLPKQGIEAITALLDFIYIAQYPTHDSITLGYLKDALDRFQKHREYFIEVEMREDFHIPKFHSLLHYIEAIEYFGTTDNYNTEMFERLHIDFAKSGWRASNHRDEFPQMMQWLSRQEKISSFETHQQNQSRDQESEMDAKGKKSHPAHTAKYPNFPSRSLELIEQKHRAPDFAYYLKIYLNQFTAQPLSFRAAANLSLPFKAVDVFNMFRFHPEGIHDDEEVKDIVKAIACSSKTPDGRFDTVIAIDTADAESTGLAGE